MKIIKKIGLMAVVLTLVLTGCSSKEQEPVDSSNPLQGTTLNLFTWDGMFPQEVLDGFKEEYGVEINYSNFDYDETMLAKLEESQGKDYDLVIADDYIIELAIEQGLVQKLDKSKISTIGNVNPLFESQFYDPTNEYTVPYGAGIPMIVYNPDEISFEITSYNDLWNSELVDNVGIIGNSRVINGITLKSLGYSFNTNNLDEINEAGEKLIELAPNIRLINDNNLQDFLLSGEVAVAFMYTSQVTMALLNNPELKAVYPKEGVGFGIMAAFIPSQAPNSDAAHAFLEYINEPEVAAKCYEWLGYFVTNKAAEELISDEMRPAIVVSDVSSIEAGEMIENVSDEALELHNEIFAKFQQATN